MKDSAAVRCSYIRLGVEAKACMACASNFLSTPPDMTTPLYKAFRELGVVVGWGELVGEAITQKNSQNIRMLKDALYEQVTFRLMNPNRKPV